MASKVALLLALRLTLAHTLSRTAHTTAQGSHHGSGRLTPRLSTAHTRLTPRLAFVFSDVLEIELIFSICMFGPEILPFVNSILSRISKDLEPIKPIGSTRKNVVSRISKDRQPLH